MITVKSNLCLEDGSNLRMDFDWKKIFEIFWEKYDDNEYDIEYESYIEKLRKYKEFYFASKNQPIMFSNSCFFKKLPYDLSKMSHPHPTLFSDDMYCDVEEVLTVMRNRAEENKADKVVTVMFFKDFSSIQIHIPKFVAIPIKDDYIINKSNKPKVFYKPVMNDLITYLKKSECIGETNEYPYNSIRFKSFDSIEILQIKKNNFFVDLYIVY